MAIDRPICSEIAKDIFVINEFGMDSQFLIIGSESALLIDTGTGCYDIPELVGTLTDKPYKVALTHGHVDHAGGIGWFERVYCHKADIDMAKRVSFEARKGFADHITALSDGIFDVTEESVMKFDKLPEFIPIDEGYVFELGGRCVRTFFTPGHTPGGLSFLIEDERILITGDACNPNTLLYNSTIDVLLDTARKIDGLQPLYDRNYNGHVGFGPMLDCRPMPESLTRDIIKLCEGILDGTVRYEITKGDYADRCAIASCATCRVQFDPDHIRSV